MTRGRILAAAAALFVAMAIAGTASAQYPTPRGSIVCTTVVNVQTNATAVSATLRDSTGRAVPGAAVNFWIVGGPGSLSASSALTDASGTATVTLLNGGNTTIAAGYDGVECRAVTQVQGLSFRPPSTGDGGLVGGSSLATAVFAACLAVMGASGLGLVAVRRRRLTSRN